MSSSTRRRLAGEGEAGGEGLRLPALFDHLVNVELEGRHQDVVQGLWAAVTAQEEIEAGLWKGGSSPQSTVKSGSQGASWASASGTQERVVGRCRNARGRRLPAPLDGPL